MSTSAKPDASPTPNLRKLATYLTGEMFATRDHLYYVESLRGTGAHIMEAPVDLSTRREVVSLPEQIGALGVRLAVDDTNVYWSVTGEPFPKAGTPSSGALFSVPIGGGSPTLLAGELSQPWAIAQDQDNLYVNVTGRFPTYADGGVLCIPKRGGTNRWLHRGGPLMGITVHDSVVYFVAEREKAIYRVATSGGPATKIVEPARRTHRLLVHDGSLYFSEFDENGAVQRAPTSGGAPTLFAKGRFSSRLLDIGGYLYFTQSGADGDPIVMRASFEGGVATPVLRSKHNGAPIAATNGKSIFVETGDLVIVGFDVSP
jgi:hypothetical protein